MQLLHRDGRFWRGQHIGKEVAAVWGTKEKAEERVTAFKSEAQARSEFAGLVKKLEGMGYTKEVPEAVIAALRVNPRDEAVSVFADSLMSKADVRGALASLARHRTDMDDFIGANADALFGPLREDVELGRVRELTWSSGFLYGVTIDEVAVGAMGRLFEITRRLAAAPAASLIREIDFSPTGDLWSDVVQALVRLSHPEVLSTLRFNDNDIAWEWDHLEGGDFRGLWRHFPSLRTMELVGLSARPALSELQGLRRLSLRGPIADSGLADVAKLGGLQALRLGLSRETDRRLALAAADLPHLRQLALERLELSERLIEECCSNSGVGVVSKVSTSRNVPCPATQALFPFATQRGEVSAPPAFCPSVRRFARRRGDASTSSKRLCPPSSASLREVAEPGR